MPEPGRNPSETTYAVKMKNYGRTIKTILVIVATSAFLALGVGFSIHLGLNHFIDSWAEARDVSRTAEPGKEKADYIASEIEKIAAVESAVVLESNFNGARIEVRVGAFSPGRPVHEQIQEACREAMRQGFNIEPYEIVCEIR